MELNVDYVFPVDFGVDGNVTGDDILGDSLEVDDDRIDDEIEIKTGGSSVEIAFHHDEKLHQDGGESVGIPLDEPFVGKEFDSEAEAHAFYNAYATRVGFVIRVSKLSRSRRDGSAIGRALVCNKEGYRMPDKREKVVRQRAETRVGCRAMILVRKVDSGKWVITKFVKEHTHALTPGKGRRDLIYDQYPDDKDRKIQDLINELRIKKRLSATYRDQLFELMKDVEEHNDNLAVKVQGVRDKLRALESRKLVPPRPR